MSMIQAVATGLIAFCILAFAVHVLTMVVLAVRARRARRDPDLPHPCVTLVRPVCGLDDMERRTLLSTFKLEAENVEIIFCVRSPNDPVVPFLRRLIAHHPHKHARLLIGDDLGTANPKLNNMAKGWRAASHDWVIFADSNLLLPKDYVGRVFGAWRSTTGVVCAPPIGHAPETFWAEVECAFLNGYQARWQYAADTVGYGFAQGKTMLWRRNALDAQGGIAALGSELAEDAATTKLVRAAGKRVHLADPAFFQPLGERTAKQVFDRQLRWAQLRRMSFTLQFVPEALTGVLPPLIAGVAGASAFGMSMWAIAAGLTTSWYAVEAMLAWWAGWHLSWRSPIAWLARDLLIPVVWCQAWTATGYEWRGNVIEAEEIQSAHG